MYILPCNFKLSWSNIFVVTKISLHYSKVQGLIVPKSRVSVYSTDDEYHENWLKSRIAIFEHGSFELYGV